MSKINYKQLFDDILNGEYDEDGYEIYRVFRDQYGMILKAVYIKQGVFIEKDLNQIIHGNAFKPKDEWEITVHDNINVFGKAAKENLSRHGFPVSNVTPPRSDNNE